jgi:hypothetical protein
MTPGAALRGQKMNARRREADRILFFFLSNVKAGQVSGALRNGALPRDGYRRVCRSA